MKTIALDFIHGDAHPRFYLPGPVSNRRTAIPRLKALEEVLPIEPIQPEWLEFPHTICRRYRLSPYPTPKNQQSFGTGALIPVKVLLHSIEDKLEFETQIAAPNLDISVTRLTWKLFESFLPARMFVGQAGDHDFLDFRIGKRVALEDFHPSPNRLTYLVCLDYFPREAN